MGTTSLLPHGLSRAELVDVYDHTQESIQALLCIGTYKLAVERALTNADDALRTLQQEHVELETALKALSPSHKYVMSLLRKRLSDLGDELCKMNAHKRIALYVPWTSFNLETCSRSTQIFLAVGTFDRSNRKLSVKCLKNAFDNGLYVAPSPRAHAIVKM